MCGIIGYTGHQPARSVLLRGLAKLEYRGYDSCGVAFNNPHLKVYKDAIRVSELNKIVPDSKASTGIGHTRWAINGAPSQNNAHPLTDCNGQVAVVHNGVITNHQALKSRLISEGHTFRSQTDTEIMAHLIEENLRDTDSSNKEGAMKAVSEALAQIKGSYALIVMIEGQLGLIFARQDCPLVIGVGNGENLIASDVTAVLPETNQVIYLEDGDIGMITDQEIRILNSGKTINRAIQKIPWNSQQADKNGYNHYMLKEIHEQPQVIRETIERYPDISEEIFKPALTESLKNLLIVACGSSYYAALVGKYFGEAVLNIPIRVDSASEFNYLQNIPDFQFGLGISQSGETADTLKAMKRLRDNGSHVIALTNNTGSSASRIAHYTLYTQAGPEISVAATKSFIAEITALYLIITSALKNNQQQYNILLDQLKIIPEKVQWVLHREDQIKEAARRLTGYEHIFYIGRGLNLPVAMEGALKLKETAYIHGEACAAGDLKHGPFALLGPNTPVIALAVRDNSHEAMLTSLEEIKARGAPLLVVASEEDSEVKELADVTIDMPSINILFSPFVNVVAVQLLAYHIALQLGMPIDFPRNLAKSVTVE